MAPCTIDFIGANALLGPLGGGGAVLRIRNKSFGSGFGSGSGLKLISDPDPVSDPDLDQKLAKFFFFVLKFLRSLIFKAALHQLCDLATNKV
jgi:hypothetical protein